MGDIRQFSIEVGQFAKKVGVAVQLAQSKVASQLFGRLIKNTPVDTGRARASWTMATKSPDRTVAPEGQKFYPKPPIPVMVAQPGEDIWLSNNLPYIGRLEDGYSGKAPQGMVKVSLAEQRLHMEAVIRAAVRLAGL